MTTLCLNMIVKNESHIIIDTLIKLLSKIKFDYYVICDTGSTDSTVNIISDFFKNKEIPGEIHTHTWKDFGYNRTLALKAAFNKTDYLLIFDADDSIEGDFVLPDLVLDSYMLKFGNESSAYERMCLVKNTIEWEYIGVLHEYINAVNHAPSKGSIGGNYFIISGRTSSRNNDPGKYLKDALILEKGYYSAIESLDSISNRYVYYCANSYLDAGNLEKAEEWYKRTLESQGWFDERYNSCLKLYELTKKMEYLVESYYHNPRRVEGIFYLVRYYTCESKYPIAMGYFNFIRDYYLNEFILDDLSTKLFANVMDYTFYLPYYMIIVCEKMKDYSTGIKMYSIIFEKMTTAGQWWSDNLFYNLQFFDYPDTPKIIKYVHFLRTSGIKVPYQDQPKETIDILFYTGFAKDLWNYTYSLNNALGGSERAVIYLSNILSKNHSIVICGDLIEETIGNIRYVNRFKLPQNIHFNTVIISRYVSFFTIFPNLSYSNVILMAHDTHFMNNLSGCNRSANQIIESSKIDYVVYLTEWQKNHYQQETHPELESVPFKIINNGIQTELFPKKYEKIKNTFVYTSGSFRGLERLLELWPEILEKWPDAKLYISSYEEFPKETDLDTKLNIIINGSNSIKHLGKLNQTQLYNLMDISEYWLYPCSFCETSCITALEMLMSKVICLYYPIAGLTDTLGDYGLKVSYGNEIKSLIELSDSRKESLKEDGVKYAVQCSWKFQAKMWKSHFFKKKLLFYAKDDFPKIVLEDYLQSLSQHFDVSYTTKIENANFDELIFVHEAFDPTVFDSFKVVSYLNTEPLNLECRLSYIIGNVNKNENYTRLKWYYDYSLSNIKIMNDHSIGNTFYLPYLTSHSEIQKLHGLWENTLKEYDYGIICSASVSTKDPSKLEPPRRRKVVEYLLNQGFTVNLVHGYGQSRDIELSKCKTILNIHGQYSEIPTTIFEHLRCNRLLDSGFVVLSEVSDNLDANFIKKYQNLKIIPYTFFFEIKKRTIIDSFTFYNELDMLEYRLNVLNDYIDKFILVESVCTFVGKPKELYYQLNKDRFKKFESKIIHIIVDDPPYSFSENKQWENEKHQRNAIERGFVDFEDSDIIILGDLDEIPSPQVLDFFRLNGISGIAQLEQEFYYYNFNSKMDHLWYFQKVINYSFYLKINSSLHDIRMSSWETIPNGGWHLSYFGNSDFISNKIKNFSHQEYNSPRFTDPVLIKDRINSGLDLFERGNKIIKTNPFENVLPIYWNKLTSFYKKPRIHCFISSCNTKGTKRLDYLLDNLKKIYFDSVNIINIGPKLEHLYVQNYSENPELFEIPCLNKIISFSKQNPGDFVLYVHTKGVSHSDTYSELNDWIDMMLYFLIDQKAIEMLYQFETVGCNFNEKPHPHFSGNFWWARTDYLKRLSSIPEINVDRNSGEYLLHSLNPTYYSLHNSNVNHYHSRYQKNRYRFLK